MTIKALYPNIIPSLSLDFANTEALDPRITFARASSARVYDGRTVAKAEENLLRFSQEFNNTLWTVEGVDRTTFDTQVAPDGTTTADTVIETTLNGAHRLDQVFSASGVVTISVFAKLGAGTRFLTIGVSRDTTHTSSATFDLSAGTNTQTQANGGIYSSPSATITAVAQGFYRCTFTVTTDTAIVARIGLNNTGTPTAGNRGFGLSYTGDGTSSLILWGAQLEQRSAVTAYTPTTTQPITNYVPVLQSAANNVARFDHNPVTGESLGLLIEEQRANLFLQSQFASGWTATRSTLTPNIIVAPDGTLTGAKLFENTDNNSHRVGQAAAYVSGTTYTVSLYAKAAERTSFGFRFFNTAFGSSASQFFDLSNGTLLNTVSGVTASITPVGNGWYRCTASRAATATSTAGNITIDLSIGATFEYTGDGTSGVFLWGAQLEAGAFPTSYIATVASQVTRSADAASMTGANFSSWYNQAEGTMYADVASSQGSIPFAYSIDSGSVANEIRVGQSSTGTNPTFVVQANSVQQVALGVSLAAYLPYKSAASYVVNNFNLAVNGTLGTTDTDGILPVVDRMRFGFRANGAQYLNGHLKKFAYYPLRLQNAELQALTQI